MINVRLSEEEYIELERFSVTSGARSISDLVRNTMHNLVKGGNEHILLASSVNEYSTHVMDLEQRVKELAVELASLRAGVKVQSADGPDGKGDAAVPQSSADAEALSDSATVKQLPYKTDS